MTTREVIDRLGLHPRSAASRLSKLYDYGKVDRVLAEVLVRRISVSRQMAYRWKAKP